jgi:starvation-inducible DNA-binding protein
MEINIGISQKNRTKIAKGLSRLLADTYSLFLKTHNFHWNVTGPLFNTLHLMFETQYNELFVAVDEIAERIRALGEFAPGSFAEYSKLSSVKHTEKVPSAEEMIRQLVVDNETVVRTARELVPLLQDSDDSPTEDLIIKRLQVHEKTAWMLRSMIEKQ